MATSARKTFILLRLCARASLTLLKSPGFIKAANRSAGPPVPGRAATGALSVRQAVEALVGFCGEAAIEGSPCSLIPAGGRVKKIFRPCPQEVRS